MPLSHGESTSHSRQAVAFYCFTRIAAIPKARFQFSYNARMLLQAGWVVAAFLIPQIPFFAGALPILFPHVVIYYLQFTGKLMPKDSANPDTSEPS